MPTVIAGLSLVVSATALLVAIRRPTVDLVNDGVRTSADELSATLATLRRTLWATAKTEDSSGVALSDAVHDVRLAFDVHRTHLPLEIAVLGREVSMAVGNYAGAPGLAYVAPEASDYPISGPRSLLVGHHRHVCRLRHRRSPAVAQEPPTPSATDRALPGLASNRGLVTRSRQWSDSPDGTGGDVDVV